MKRTIILLLVSAMTLLLAACSDNKDQEEVSEKPSEAVSSSEPSAEESSTDEKELIDESFGKLFASDEFYIRAGITVETSSSPLEVSSYDLTVAVDKNSQTAMTDMIISDGQRAHMIIRDNYSYQLNDEEQTYKKQLYAESVADFALLYTKELYLGVTEPLIYEASGKESIDPDNDGTSQQADYIKFRMSDTEISADKNSEVYITYYFIDEKPVMEIMEKTGGKTTFVFKELSQNIPDKSVFDLDENYYQE